MMRSPSRRTFVAQAMAMLGAAAAGPVALAREADAYPNRPIRLIVGYAPGGSADVVARLLAQGLAGTMGQPVVVENKTGAGGTIATDFVAKAPPDGYTLILIPSGHATIAAMRQTLPYNPVSDLTFVSTVTTYPMFVAVAATSPIKTFADLLQQARAPSSKLAYSSAGIGTAQHLLGEWFNAEAKTELVHVPYKGSAAALSDVLAGQIDVMLDTATTVLPMQRSGKLRVLAVTSEAGKALIPGVPAVSEFLPGLRYESWLGVAAPANLPRPIVDRLNTELAKALQNSELQARLAELGGRATPSTPAEFRSRVETDIDKFRRIVAARNIPLE